ncbi:MAG: DNA photolyase, partial [Gammaproteobacteria bacterium]|nr:DNA photolyase [Gammaproteobacteria bacterium]
KNYYFSHMLNCIYDCRYCFLQGMYRSAHYLLFVNYESFAEDIEKTVLDHPDKSIFFYSGYDCDSLALEPATHFVDFILPVFERLPTATLELRTKSTQIRSLLDRDALKNCVVAFSLSPDNIVEHLEAKTPSLSKRIEAMRKLQAKGWQIGLRFDPLIYHTGYQQNYSQMFDLVAEALDVSLIHSISLGSFRMPEKFFRNMVKLYPGERLFAGSLEENDGMVSYEKQKEQEMTMYCHSELLKYWPDDIVFPCYSQE